jgi:hypothetical protein
MENASFGHRLQDRQQQQQQPQQSTLYPATSGLAKTTAKGTSRQIWQALAKLQARKQMGDL